MKLHYETVSPLLTETLQKIVGSPVFNDFILVGGTCLSLQLGHRRSIDIDMFTDIDYDSMDTKSIKEFLLTNFPYCENLDSLDHSALGYSLRVGTSATDLIKLDFFYTEKFIFPTIIVDNIRLADLREIAAMKMGAIAQDMPRQKDFWDIHELNDKYSLQDMIEWGVQRNSWAISKDDILKGFQKIDEILESPDGIDCFRGKYWELVKDDLKELVNGYNVK
ncbi:nucleotidyl transferase AbiEii/AbiGii toxin family protein [Parabacteroides faecis]|uniref:nucleotidyl transferase AbiEii/AbiGii toxin family protein n=1 Tax=Parabacteroides faecis TaxID=1217282 RepID=UPI0021641A1A|nr:nucleotidyl transferase AbiEii/AbiGii toxin family protein [Parabacteroides faecis]MCS2892693.1 nucleotidyl transferase AbiEii/AbiGii toxin family protein [Parabacteroides faecis]UVQ48686.1 nucleotidyl transferase AbiEii/AbiGii toxin family protein [Parabacteroides faecis]